MTVQHATEPATVHLSCHARMNALTTADIVRGTNTAGCCTSRPRWTLTRHWLGTTTPAALDPAAGYREIVRRWLYTFGPGTEDDLVWWLRATRTIVRAALAALGALPVTLDTAATGRLLPDDLQEVADPGLRAALLPVLDPTVMGPARPRLLPRPAPRPAVRTPRQRRYDRLGRWPCGGLLGCWVQDVAGRVHLRLLEPVTPAERRLLDQEAQRLTAWLDGFRVTPVHTSPAMRT